MIKDLIKLANNLDAKGLKAEADALDSLIQKLASKKANNLIISFEELEKRLKDNFPEEMNNGSNKRKSICELLEDGEAKTNIEITLHKDSYNGLPNVYLTSCIHSFGKQEDIIYYKDYNNRLIDIVKFLANNGFMENEERSYTWGGNISESWGRDREGPLYYNEKADVMIFEPILKERESFSPKKNIDGTWIHVLNNDKQISSAEDFNKFLTITGEVSVSKWDPAISRGYFVRHPRDYKSSFAIIMSGKASYCWDGDIWSVVDPRTGLRTPTRPKSTSSNHDECFLVPAKSKPILALVGPGANPEEAKSFMRAAEAIGLPVQIMSLRTDPYLNNNKEIKNDEWLDQERSFRLRASKNVKILVSLANNLDAKGLRKEANALDSLIQKLAAKKDFYDLLKPYKDDFYSEDPGKIKSVLLEHDIPLEDILEPEEEEEEEWPVKFKQHWTDRDGNEGFDIIDLKTVGDAYLAVGY